MGELQPSDACCNAAPRSRLSYEEKGTWKTFDGMKCYVTGPQTATSAILLIYDIFGVYPQTIHGADLLSQTGTGTRVFMPDFFGSNAADLSNWPADTPAKQAYIMKFFHENASPAEKLLLVPGLVSAMNRDAGGGDGVSSSRAFEKWAVVGYCWGGKMVSLLCGKGGGLGAREAVRFVAGAQCHPSLMDPDDAKSIDVPMMVLASGDEDTGVMQEFQKRLGGDKVLETFPDMVHGWMASKGDLDDPHRSKEFYRGYDLLRDFLAKYI